MARVYVSSTFEDLREYREAVYRALRKLQHDVRAMEDYVARDDRPVEMCIKDVQRCDLYVGLIGFRYGYVPDAQNPDHKSITEMEYDAAGAKGIPRLMFLAKIDGWEASKTDAFNNENEAGERVKRFRKRIETDKSFQAFSKPADLAAIATASVAQWDKERLGVADDGSVPRELGPGGRVLERDVLLLASSVDQPLVEVVARGLTAEAVSSLHRADLILSETDGDLTQADSVITKCHATAVVLSPASLQQLTKNRLAVSRLLEIAIARCGGSVALLSGIAKSAVPAEWTFSSLVEMPADLSDPATLRTNAAQWVSAILQHSPTVRQPSYSGLPVIVCTMTRDEALDLIENKTLLSSELEPEQLQTFEQTWRINNATKMQWIESYAATRLGWKPFGGAATVQQTLAEIVKRLGESEATSRRRIKLQYYPLDPLLESPPRLRALYRSVADTGCVVVIDEMSMLRPEIKRVVSGLIGGPQTSVVTLAPTDSAARPTDRFLADVARRQLGGAFDRFELDFDPRCEFGLEGDLRLRRWLHTSLPVTLRSVRQPPPDRTRLSAFKDELGQAKRGYSDLIGNSDDSK